MVIEGESTEAALAQAKKIKTGASVWLTRAANECDEFVKERLKGGRFCHL